MTADVGETKTTNISILRYSNTPFLARLPFEDEDDDEDDYDEPAYPRRPNLVSPGVGDRPGNRRIGCISGYYVRSKVLFKMTGPNRLPITDLLVCAEFCVPDGERYARCR